MRTPSDFNDRGALCLLAKRDPPAAVAATPSLRFKGDVAIVLAYAARYSFSEQAVPSLINDALAAASQAEDPCEVITASSSAIAAALFWNLEQLAHHATQSLLDLALTIASRPDRSNGLFVLFEAACAGPSTLWYPVAAAVLAASDPVQHWRQRRNAVLTVSIVNGLAPERARTLLSHMTDPVTLRKAARRVNLGITDTPYQFFP